MFGLGWLEVGLIILAAVLVFGPKKNYRPSVSP